MCKKIFRSIAVVMASFMLIITFGGFDTKADLTEVDTAILDVNPINKTNNKKADSEIYRVTLISSLAAASYADHTHWSEDIRGLEVINMNKTETIEYVEVFVSVGGINIQKTPYINGTTYISIEDFSTAIGIKLETVKNITDDITTYTTKGLEINLPIKESYIIANGRALPTEKIITTDGEVLLPISLLTEIFVAETSFDATKGKVNLSKTDNSYIASAEEVYVEEDLYWLSKIIFAESGNQSMEGMVGVGNVVLNRVDDPTCPSTIKDVIFDDEYGVQFHVVENGTIHLDPSEGAIIAAKLCLEGYNNVGESIYFVNPLIGTTDWFQKTRTFVARIGNHDFYA